METILNLIIQNVYLYICILIVLVILTTILVIVITNNKNREKIKENFEEADKLEQEIQEIENGKVSNELEDIIKKMQEDIEVKPEDVVKKFEEEQEEKAIISYQELVDNVKAGKIEVIEDDNSEINYVESLIENSQIDEEPIMGTSIESEQVVTPEMVKDAIQSISNDSIKEEPKKFKKSEFISPIFGIMDNKIEYSTVKKQENTLDIMNTRDYNKLTEEIKKQEEFLNALKEFRNNL